MDVVKFLPVLIGAVLIKLHIREHGRVHLDAISEVCVVTDSVERHRVPEIVLHFLACNEATQRVEFAFT